MTPYRDSPRPMPAAPPPRWRPEPLVKYVLGKADVCLTMKMRFMELALERQPFNLMLMAFLLALEVVVVVLFVTVMFVTAVVVVGGCIYQELRSIGRGVRRLSGWWRERTQGVRA